MNKQLITVGTITLLLGITAISIISNTVIASPGSIYVYTPSSGSTYYEGDIVLITWTSSDNYVKIELYRGGNYYSTISLNTSNVGSYSWVIPSGYSSSYYYKIRVINLGNENEYDDSGSFYINKKSITVSSPSSGETWYKGESYTIRWDSENAGSYVKIQYKLGSSYYTIISSTYNDGSYSWLIPSTLSSSSSYQIKITSTSDSSIYGHSGYFSIGERSITITSPSGGETWYRGETYTITWTSENAGSHVRIQYKIGYNTYYYTIVSSTSNDGSYEWAIPNSLSLSSQYKIKITSYTYSNVYDISEYFSIDQRYIDVESPSRYDKWYPNETYTITWDSENAGNHVDIRLYKNGVYCTTIASNQNNSGSYIWTVPSIFSSDSDYTIEIRSKEYSSVYDYSDEFSIGGRSITIASPNDGETWYKGESYTITWESENAGPYVDIELYKDGERYLTIDSNVENSGIYFWEILSNPPSGSSYQIKITSSSYSNVYAYSEGNFTIEETFFQQLTTPLLVIIIIIVAIATAYTVIIKIRKEKMPKPDENAANMQQLMQPQSQFDKTEISQEEYDQIWEGNK